MYKSEAIEMLKFKIQKNKECPNPLTCKMQAKENELYKLCIEAIEYWQKHDEVD